MHQERSESLIPLGTFFASEKRFLEMLIEIRSLSDQLLDAYFAQADRLVRSISGDLLMMELIVLS